MALRTFVDRDGQTWRVWNVQPSAGGRTVRPGFQEGWLCFEREDGSDRCRLPGTDVPADWLDLPDERLDLLRRLCHGGTPVHGTKTLEDQSARAE